MRKTPLYIFRSIKQGIKNLIQWFPIIWKDRQWDDGYIYLLLEKKFKMMADMHLHEGISVKSNEVASQLYRASFLCHCIEADDYMDIAMNNNHYYEKFPDPITVLDIDSNGEDKKSPNVEQELLFLKCSKESIEMAEKDKKELWTLIKDNIDTWWD